jgi:hypothetical protein
MSKETNPEWPDPTKWANQLHLRLEEEGENFARTPWTSADDPDECEGLNLKQVYAARALLVVCSALRELPSFEKSKGVGALHTVAAALNDVVEGGQPRLFRPARPGLPGGDGLERRYVRAQVVIAVRFLVEAHGIAETAACKKTAQIFAEAGATGRQGGPLSVSTVIDWCGRTHPLAENPQDVHLFNDVEAKLNAFRCHPNWPGEYRDAIQWVTNLANDPLVVSKYG